MARNKRIASISLDGLRPLGTTDQRSWELIVRALDEMSGTGEYRTLFAEPVSSPKGDIIDWYVETAETPVALDQLDAESRQQTTERVGQMVGAILEHAASLEASKDAETKRLGAALRNATEIPGEDFIYVAGEQPVIVCWSYHRATTQAPHGVLSAMVSAQPEPPPRSATNPAPGLAGATPAATAGVTSATPVIVAPIAAKGYGWLWWLLWLLIGLTTAAILYLMIVSCGLSQFGILNFCPATQAEPIVLESNRSHALRQELTLLQRKIGARTLQCGATRVQTAPQANRQTVKGKQTVALDSQFDSRLEQQGSTGDSELRITLIWDTGADLDLKIVCPNNAEIWARHQRACGGVLDIDANGAGDHDARIMKHPVENIVFHDRPQTGDYAVVVTLWKWRSLYTGSTPFKLRVQKASGSLYFNEDLKENGATFQRVFQFP